ncbi:hypothetical protein GQS_00790 [Thermococcus sp. 4557]|uniref:DNA replication complex subunit Gins51 n=1 Tax=Thermococcus sp. (strain CGMCC 1.5172 / 4557) TaxID=1042877 RepID=UPI000219E95D|nr:hypothetical protein [Thermococcus sp. 4557]AEK72061.1 hypothetical protein GQS_00790 [Thermococcus sp. 4557]
MDIVKLRELLEAELSSPELTELDGEFYEEFDSLIKALKLSAESSRERGEDIEERLYLAQLGIAEKLMREIIKIRLHKIVDLAVEGIPGELTAEEKKIFTVLRAFIEREELEGLSVPTPGKETAQTVSEVATKAPELKKSIPSEAYIIKVDLPKILDPELREYGPFRAGDLVIIPRSLGKVLVERDAAERIRIAP